MDPKKVSQIEVSFPPSERCHLKLGVGACRLRIAPGAEGWVGGTYSDPSGALPFSLRRDDGTVRISQEYNLAGALGLFSGVPAFELTLGKAKPFLLSIDSGGTDAVFELGGLPITALTLRQGAGKLSCSFSAPNPAALTVLRVDAGAVALEMKGLSNANFAEMMLDGGAASYDLDFGGTLQRDGHVRVVTGVSSVRIRVPSALAARIHPESVLGSLEIGDGFMKKEGAFWTEAAVAGKTPVLTIDAAMTLGALRISSS